MNKIFKNRIVIATISLILAISLGIVFYYQVDSHADKTSVIKAISTIPKGTQITEDMLKEEMVGGYNLSKTVLKNKSEILGKYAMADLSTGDLILSEKVSDTITNSDDRLHQLKGDKFAISVKIHNFADGLSDKLVNGDIVSCIITDDKSTRIPAELTYVEVIAATKEDGADKQSDKTSDTGSDKKVASVTLLAAPKQAELLARYDFNADIHIALVYRGEKEKAQQFLDKQDQALN